MKKYLSFLFLLISVGVTAQSDSLSVKPKTYLAIEIDPAPFILGGYSLSLKFSPAAASHFSCMASVYQSRLPDNMISNANFDKGFRNLRLNRSYAFFTDYFLKSTRKGFHFGPSVFLYNKSVDMISTGNNTSFKSIYPNLRAGFVFRPLRNSGFYINPWANIGKEFLLDHDNSINGVEHSAGKINYILALHFGYGVEF